MNIFDIIGPVMVGPSSSHTAGAARIGRITGELLGERPVKAAVKFHGSFAQTFKGHGTDKAVAAGLLGMLPDDTRIRESLTLAEQEGLNINFETISVKDAHPNTVIIEAEGISGRKLVVEGASIGGGSVVIKRINDLSLEFTGEYNTLVIPHKDIPGAVASVSNILACYGINIASMKVYRPNRRGEAMMVIETDQEISRELVEMLGKLPLVVKIMLIEKCHT